MDKYKTQGYRNELQGVRDSIVPTKPGNARGISLLYGTHPEGLRPSSRLIIKRARIRQRSADNPEMIFNQLMHHFSEKNLRQWFHELPGKEATGIDGIS